MLVLGTDSVARPLNQGRFFCPFCLAEAPYALNRSRLFFTIYYVPVVPLKDEGSFVECKRCLSTFETNVLGGDCAPDDFPPVFQRTIVRMLVLMANVDSRFHDLERREILLLWRDAFAFCISEAEIDDLLSDLDCDAQRDAVTSFLRASRPLLNNVGREKIFIAALRVAKADGTFFPCEQSFLMEVGRALGLKDVHIEEMLKEC